MEVSDGLSSAQFLLGRQIIRQTGRQQQVGILVIPSNAYLGVEQVVLREPRKFPTESPTKRFEKASSQVLTSHSSTDAQKGWEQFHNLVSSRDLLELGGLHDDYSSEFLIGRQIIRQTCRQQQIASYILMCPF